MAFDVRNLKKGKDFARKKKSTQTVWNKFRCLTIDRTPTGPPGSMGKTVKNSAFQGRYRRRIVLNFNYAKDYKHYNLDSSSN